MPPTISRIIQALEPSATLAMAAKARELKAAGKKIYDFSVGEPDFNTPEHICQAATKAMRDGHTHYTASSGIIELRTAVAKDYQQRHGLQYNPLQVIVSNGAKHALHNAFTVLCDPGDEVIIPAPYWVSYAELVKLASGKPVIVPTEEAADFKLTPAKLRAALTPKTKILLLCSPSNPTGSMYSGEELAALADIVLERDLTVISDEIYEHLVYGGRKFVSFATVRPGLQERVITINGVSKAYAMTGWRIGWSIAPQNIAKAIDSLQSQETTNASSVSQYAAIAALEGSQQCVQDMLGEFTKRREYVRQRLAALPKLTVSEMGGAFYAFFNISAHLGRTYRGKPVNNSNDWCLTLLEQQGVATVAGSAFGAEGYVRMSFATSMTNIQAGFDGIEAFLKSEA